MKRLYVLTSNKLDPIYASVQGGHAVAQWCLEHPDNDWKNSYLIYLKADVDHWKRKLQFLGADFSEFNEPDLNNITTAIAMRCDDGAIFRRLKTLRVA